MYSQTFGRSPSRITGFTLIELVVTIAVAGILASIAAPSFRSFIVSQRIKNASFDLVSALSQARSEAITRNTDVSFSKAAGSWSNGWTVSAGATTLVTHEAFKALTVTDNTNLNTSLAAVTYGRDGRVVWPATVNTTRFTITPSPALSTVKCRLVSIGLSGVPSSSECP